MFLTHRFSHFVPSFFLHYYHASTGRAFYSYDPNPPSYFLKIEYYNPYDRHMIRALLQNSNCTNDTSDINQHRNSINHPKELKFHCFEAHIPYTMQFFKDYNLAGLKYIHLDNGHYSTCNSSSSRSTGEIKLLFRTPLPKGSATQGLKQLPRHIHHDTNIDNFTAVDSEFLILQDNTAKSLLWDSFLHQLLQQQDRKEETMHEREYNDDEIQLLKWYKPPKKVTDCENLIEFDVDASSILNIYEVLTAEDVTATQRLDETRNIHWRAVPSLREIWEEEKARMDILLEDYPEDNFLRNQTISSKKVSGAAVSSRKRGRGGDTSMNLAQTILSDEKKGNTQRISGSKEAINGILKLFGVDGNPSSEKHHDSQSTLFHLYYRAMADILDRHQHAVEKEERHWKDLYAHRSLSISSPSDSERRNLSLTVLSAEHDPLLNDLGALQGQFASPHEPRFTSLTQPRYSGNSSNTSSTTTREKFISQHGLLSEFTPPTPEQLVSRKQNILTSFHRRRSIGFSWPDLTPQITAKPLSINTLRRTQTQIAEEIKLEALAWEDSDGEEDDEGNQDTEESLERELLSLEEEGSTNVSALNIHIPCNHGVILELKRSVPTTLTCVRNKSTAALFLGYSGEFDKLRTYIGEQSGDIVLSPENLWYEQSCEPPCPKLIRSKLALKQSHQHDDTLHSNGETDVGHVKRKKSQPRSKKRKADANKLQIPLTLMSIEIHVQCRLAKVGSMGVKEVAMTPNPDRDVVSAIVFVFGKDHGGGEVMEIIEKGCLYLPVDVESSKSMKPTLTYEDVLMEAVQSERDLFYRFASIVQVRDPDILVSWDTHGSGIGYLIKRGVALKPVAVHDREDGKSTTVDMALLLGRTPKAAEDTGVDVDFNDSLTQTMSKIQHGDDIKWKGSGLGSEWDDLKGSGVAASSIVGRLVWCGWKITSEEVKVCIL